MPSHSEVCEPLNRQGQVITHLARDMSIVAKLYTGDTQRWMPRDIRRMEKALKAFWRLYSKGMREVENYTKPGLESKGMELIREFHHMFLHAKEGSTHGMFQSSLILELHAPQVLERRIRIASRLVALEAREKRNQDKYPTGDRYRNLILDRDVLLHNLSEKNRWILDLTVPLSHETGVLFCLATLAMLLQSDWPRRMQSSLDYAIENGIARIPRVANISTPSLKWLVTSDKHEKTCHICRYNFGHAFSDEALTEPAVETRCGHSIGKKCLESWVKAANNSCPICRQELYDKDRILPKAYMPSYHKSKEIYDQVREFDSLIDNWLLQGPQVIYRDEAFWPTMMKLYHLLRVYCHAEDDMFLIMNPIMSLRDSDSDTSDENTEDEDE